MIWVESLTTLVLLFRENKPDVPFKYQKLYLRTWKNIFLSGDGNVLNRSVFEIKHRLVACKISLNKKLNLYCD